MCTDAVNQRVLVGVAIGGPRGGRPITTDLLSRPTHKIRPAPCDNFFFWQHHKILLSSQRFVARVPFRVANRSKLDKRSMYQRKIYAVSMEDGKGMLRIRIFLRLGQRANDFVPVSIPV